MEFLPGNTVGIDLGTTFSTVACLDDTGNPVALPNEEGRVETPSLVLLAESGHVIVGPNRTRAAMEDPKNVVERIKRHVGSSDYKRTFDGKVISPEFISALILKKLKQDAEKQIGKIGNAVVTVPYYFNDARRKATQDAGKIAGINVIDIINEPTAATLTYAWMHGQLGGAASDSDLHRMTLVFDLGGGTFDVTIVRYSPTHFQVLATDGDVHLGGIDWNERLVDFVAQQFQERFQVDPREIPATVQMLRNDCDLAKIALSKEQQVSIPCRSKDKSISVPITRKQFEEMSADLFQRLLDTTRLVMEQAKISSSDLDAVVLVGGSTLMPKVADVLKEATGHDPNQELSPYTAVAQGAAIHAAILEAQHQGQQGNLADKIRKMLATVKQEEVNSHGLGVTITSRSSGKRRNHVMIPRNTQLPFEVKRTFHTNHENQQRVNIQVNEGEAPDPQACSLMGNCRITNLPEGLPKGSSIEVTYAFDKSGRITVSAKDMTGGVQATIEIQRQGSLNDEQIDAYRVLADHYKVE